MAKHHSENHTQDKVVILGRLSTSQDGTIVFGGGLAPCHTAGHGNCPKVAIVIEN